MRLKILGLVAALSAPTGVLAAENPWSLHDALGAPPRLNLSGSVRVRYEGIGGQVRPGAAPTENFISTRTILSAEYDAGPVRFGAEMYDGRVFGAQPGSAVGSGEIDTLEIAQAYVAKDFTNPFGEGTSATISAGRLILMLGSRRLVASDDYRNTANTYTGVTFEGRGSDGSSLTLLYTLPNIHRPEDQASLLDGDVQFDKESFDLALWGGYLFKPNLIGRTAFDATVLGLDERDSLKRPTRDRRLRTVAARLIAEPRPGAFDFEVEGAYQFGSTSSGVQANATKLDVSATFLHAEAGYQFELPWSPHLVLEYDRGSGDDEDESYGRFDTLYGMRGADFAPGSIYGAILRTNLESLGLRLEGATRRLDAHATYRWLWAESATDSFAATGVRDPSGRSGTYAGTQFEARLRYWLIPQALRLQFTAIHLSKAGLLVNAPNAPRTGDLDYGSVALTASF